MPIDTDQSGIYLSVVVASGGDQPAGSLRATVDSWVELAQRFSVPSELIVVAWGTRRDTEQLRASAQCRVRVLEIPFDLPLNPVIARNAGIRRASGQFILATNPGVIFSPELMQFLGRRELEPNVLYRADRYDVAGEIPVGQATVSCGLSSASGFPAPSRIHSREGTFDILPDGRRAREADDISPSDDSIVLGRGWFPAEHDGGSSFRWLETTAEIRIEKPASALSHLIFDVETGPSAGGPLPMELVNSAGEVLASATIDGRCLWTVHVPDNLQSAALTLRIRGGSLPLAHDLRLLNARVWGVRWQSSADEISPVRPALDWSAAGALPDAARIINTKYLHTNACDDFLLLARANWSALRGYPQIPALPVHIEELFCYAVHHAGIRESILDSTLRIFRFQDANDSPNRGSRMEDDRVRSWITHMRRFNAPMIFNRSDWGLASLELPSTDPHLADQRPTEPRP